MKNLLVVGINGKAQHIVCLCILWICYPFHKNNYVL
jgi:hypothetical protein